MTSDVIYDEMFKVMVTGQDPTGEWNIPALRKGFTVDITPGFGVHGDDRHGRWDLEFPTMFEALEWYRVWSTNIKEFKIRENDTVTDLNMSVVMTMTPNFKF